MSTASLSPQTPSSGRNDTFPVVGIGGCPAEGMESTSTLLAHLPNDTGMAFVLVQPRDPGHDGAVVQRLANVASMPVVETTTDVEIRPDHVYVIAPGTRASVEGDKLRVGPSPSDDGQKQAIDFFLESLAADRGERAIGVVLSGTSGDGLLGLAKLKDEGAITLVQDDSSDQRWASLGAATAQAADFAGSPADIARELVRTVLARQAARIDALVANERHFRRILDSLPAAVYASDANGRVSHFNAACVALSGRTPRLGVDDWSDVWSLFHADGTPVAPSNRPMNQALAGNGAPPRSEYIVERPDGSRLWCEMYPSAQYDEEGRSLGGVNMLVDVTERHDAGVALRLREEREKALFEAAPMGLFVCDSNGVIQTYNQHAANLWGREPRPGVDRYADLIPLRNSDGAPVPEEDIRLNQVLATGRPRNCSDMSIERPDGSLLPVMGSISPLKNANGEVTGAIASFVDVTEHKRIEEELREADRHKDEFIAMLAHELRNPLAPMRNALELVRPLVDALPQTPCAPAANDTVRRAMDMLDRQVNQMVRLVDDLLDVNRMSTGRIELRRERIDLGAFVQSAVQGLRWVCEGKGQSLTVTSPSTPVFVNADPARLSQVIGNLVHNASKFTDPGGRIEVGVRTEGEDVIARVTDSGVGIAPEDLERVFEMFAQVDSSRRRSAGGLGIGLPLARDLAVLHGGTVTARSQGVGQGSEFVLRLPRFDDANVETDARQPQTDSTTASESVGSKRVLVVDDNEDAAESLALLLETKGYETRAAFDGLQGLQSVAEFDPDVVVLDIGMPRLDGLEVARRLRAQYPDRGLRIVALTGWGLPDDRERSAQAGFDAHMVKPVAFETLAAWVKANT